MFAQYVTLVLPGMLIFTVGMIIPLLLSFGYSLTSWDGRTPAKEFIGTDNYFRLFTDSYVRDAWVFTIKFTIVNTVVQNILALGFAILLDGGIKYKKLYRSILFIPCLISAVVVGFIWSKMYNNVLPSLNELFGTNINFLFFGREETVLTGLVIANNWQWVGYWMLIYLAALQSIPVEMYEAAIVDGASAARRFWKITLPMLAPAVTICVVGITTGSLRVYDLLVASTNGGPGRASTSIIFQIFNTAMNNRQYGYGSALSITLVIALLAVAVIQVGFLRKREVQL
jgi:raffinose/stachyose/melibiose transport system permease protein